MGYNGSADAKCWKLHTCFNCSTVFRYLLQRKVTATGGTEAACRENLGKACVKAMQEGVDSHPCPECGLIQPEMVRAKRLSSYTLWTWLAVVLMIALAITLAFEVAVSTVVGIGLVGGTLCAVMLALPALNNPNKDVVSNQRRGQAAVQNQLIHVEGVAENAPARKTDLPGLTEGKNGVAFAMLGLALSLLALPEVARTVRGWPTNDGFFPAVVGPGDKVTYYFHRGLSSIKGYWKGRVSAEMDGQKLAATTNDNNWGNSISVKSSEKSSSVSLWTTLDMPAEAKPRSDAHLALKVAYVAPVMSGSDHFREEEGTVDESPLVKLADAGAGSTYRSLGWMAVWVGSGLLIAAGCLLGKQADRLQGNPHQALVAED